LEWVFTTTMLAEKMRLVKTRVVMTTAAAAAAAGVC
jgi:hypothetical protein